MAGTIDSGEAIIKGMVDSDDPDMCSGVLTYVGVRGIGTIFIRLSGISLRFGRFQDLPVNPFRDKAGYFSSPHLGFVFVVN